MINADFLYNRHLIRMRKLIILKGVVEFPLRLEIIQILSRSDVDSGSLGE